MWENVTPFDGLSQCVGLEILSIWDVEADPSYQVQRQHMTNTPARTNPVIMCYTLAGNGLLTLRTEKTFQLTADSLLFIRSKDILNYRCEGPSWRFHWIKFVNHGPLPIPLDSVFNLPHQESYSSSFYKTVHAARQNTQRHLRLAAAIFNELLHEWSVLFENDTAVSPHLALIQKIIDQMHDRVAENWPVSEMAEQSNMSEPAFRNAFRQVTKQSPKRFYTAIRMAMAEGMLRKNNLSIAEVADHLGFSDPAHLSKAFKQHFGFPPSHIKTNTEITID